VSRAHRVHHLTSNKHNLTKIRGVTMDGGVDGIPCRSGPSGLPGVGVRVDVFMYELT